MSTSRAISIALLLVATTVPFSVQGQLADQPPALSGVTFKGQVVNKLGEPVENARVFLLPIDPAQTVLILPTSPLQVTTDDRGEYQFENLQTGVYGIWAETDTQSSLSRPLFADRIYINELDKEYSPKTITLHPAGSLKFEVVDASTGTPIQNATVSITADIEREATTDELGFAELGGLAPWTWRSLVVAPGFANETIETVETAIEFQRSHRVEMRPEKKMSGTVLDEQGAAVKNAIIYVRPSSNFFFKSAPTKTDTSGKFQVSGLPADTDLTVSVQASGFERFEKTNIRLDASESSQAAIDQPPFELTRRKTYGDCILTVVDETGEPIEGARVINPPVPRFVDSREAISDKNGVAVLKDVSKFFQGPEAVIIADGYPLAFVTLDVGPAENPGRARVALNRGFSLKAKLVYPDGAPLAAAPVICRGPKHQWRQEDSQLTSDDGFVEFTGLPQDVFISVLTPKGFSPVNELPLTLGTGEIPLITLVADARYRFNVVDATTNLPITDFRYYITELTDGYVPSGQLAQAVQSVKGIPVQHPEGKLEINKLPPGLRTSFKVVANGFRAKIIENVSPDLIEDDVQVPEIALEPIDDSSRLTVSGMVVSHLRTPVVGARVVVVGGRVDPRTNGWEKPQPALSKTGIPSFRTSYNWHVIVSGNVEGSSFCSFVHSTITDEHGRFTFQDLTKEPWVEILYSGAGFPNGRRILIDGETSVDTDSLVLETQQPGRVEVEVDTQYFTRGAQVKLSPFPAGARDRLAAYWGDSMSLKPGESIAVFDNIPAGSYVASVDLPVEIRFADPGNAISDEHQLQISVTAGELTKVSLP